MAKKSLSDSDRRIVKALGARIARARGKMRINGAAVSQSKLGELSSAKGSVIDGRKVRAIENGERDFMFSTVVRVADAVGISLSWMKRSEAVVVSRPEAPLMAMLQSLIATEDEEALTAIEHTLRLALKSHREAARRGEEERRTGIDRRRHDLKEA